jgi:hypothetical protein
MCAFFMFQKSNMLSNSSHVVGFSLPSITTSSLLRTPRIHCYLPPAGGSPSGQLFEPEFHEDRERLFRKGVSNLLVVRSGLDFGLYRGLHLVLVIPGPAFQFRSPLIAFQQVLGHFFGSRIVSESK